MTESTALEEVQALMGKIPVHLGDLLGNGNAFWIMGQVQNNANELARYLTPHRKVLIDAIVARCLEEMRQGDFDHLLDTVEKYCFDLDGSIEAYRDDQERAQYEDDDEGVA